MSPQVTAPTPHTQKAPAQPPPKTPKKAPPGPKEPSPVPPLATYAEVGDIVDWFPGADKNEKGQPLIVTQVGQDTRIDGNLVNLNYGPTIPMDGAYHVDHRMAQVDNGGGGWRHRPLTLAVRTMLVHTGLLVWAGDNSRLELGSGPRALPADPTTEPPKA